jgi:hypothetical protein
LSNTVTFVFNASDIIPMEVRRLCKIVGNELGAFSFEVTIQTTSSQTLLNEFLLRGYQLPIKIEII